MKTSTSRINFPLLISLLLVVTPLPAGAEGPPRNHPNPDVTSGTAHDPEDQKPQAEKQQSPKKTRESPARKPGTQDQRAQDRPRQDRERSAHEPSHAPHDSDGRSPPARDHHPRREENEHSDARREDRDRVPRRYDAREEREHGHDHRPRYWEGKRQRYDYVYTPWYFTHFLAPVPRAFFGIGHIVKHVPKGHVRVAVGGLPYFYYSGTFYRQHAKRFIVVPAPIGAVVRTLPPGFMAVAMGLDTYYLLNDTYYIWDALRDSYIVIAKPPGIDQAISEVSQGRLFVYPEHGQSEELQARDRYECHRWAVTQSGIDPSLEESNFASDQNADYRRAMAACLTGRRYSVK